MAKYLVLGNYTAEGLKVLLKEGGSGRRGVVETAVKSMGGKVDAFYYAFGEADVVSIIDVPDNVSAAALAIGISAAGTAGVKTTVLLTADEVDQATKKTLAYRAASS